MLILKRLHLQNFMSVEELDIEFDSKETIAICGKNGSGKSTLLYAIAFLLTGYREGESYRDYVRGDAESAKLFLEAYLKGEPLYCEAEIIGEQKKGQVQPTKRKTVYKGVTYLNSEHSQFIKEQDLEYVEPLIFFFQNSMNGVIDARPADRVAMLKKIFKFEFSDVVSKLKDEQEQNKTAKIANAAILDELNTKSFETQRLAREIMPSLISNWESRVEEIRNTLLQMEDLDESAYNKITNDLESTQNNIRSTSSKMTQSEKDVSQLREQIRGKRDFLNNYDLLTLSSSLESLKEALEKHKVEYEEKKDKYTELSKNLNIEEFKKKDLLGQLEISRTGICHACGQAITPEHLRQLEEKNIELERGIENLKKEIIDLGYDARDAKGRSLNQQITETSQLIDKFKNEEQNVQFLEKRLSGFEELNKEREEHLKELKIREESLLAEKEKYLHNSTLSKQKEQLTQELNELKNKIDNAKEDKIRNAEKKRYNEKIELERKEVEGKKEELGIKINNISEDIEDTKEALSIFENSFPSFLILQATQKLEDCINEIVQRIFPEMRVKLQMQRAGVTFRYSPNGDTERWLPVSMASGAQKAVLSLAYKSSLTRMYGISCILLDEVDASCTSENARMIYEFIASLDCFQQLIFISHRPESIEAARLINSDIRVYQVEDGKYTEID